MNCSARGTLLTRLLDWEIQARRSLTQCPSDFREALLLGRSPFQQLRHVLQPWQKSDLAALDAAWRRIAGLPASARPQRIIRRSYIERPRGHSKTTDISVQILWVLLAARRQLSGLAAAADREQATLIHRAMHRLAQANPELCGDLKFIEHVVSNPRTGSELQIISSDVASSFGALPDFVVCDELCHWKSDGLWNSLLSSSAKRPECVLAVLTNAGIGRGWQWRVREHARSSPDWHFSSLQGPHAPWITEDSLAEQRALLPEPVFERLWLNIWQHSDGEFVTLQEAEACRDESLQYQRDGRHDVEYIAAIDYAEKRDYTVGCVCHREGNKVIVDRMDVVKPTPTRPTPVRWVHDWIEDVAARFRHVRFHVDAHQLVSLIQDCERRYPIERFDFQGGVGNHRLTVTLRELITQRQIAWYRDCGSIAPPRSDGGAHLPVDRDDLETELASLLVRESVAGRIRFDHKHDGVHHDDRAFTLALAALMLCERPIETSFLEVTPPSLDGSFLF